MALSLPPIPDLATELAALLAQIPRGRVTTYGDLAVSLGDKSAARWVGERLLDHPHDEACPCHRVVLRSGEPGKYIAGDAAAKLRRLESEGVASSDGRVDLDRFGVREFVSSRPLAELLAFQDAIPAHTVLAPFGELPELVAGVDVAYGSDGNATAALAIVEAATGRLMRSHVVRRPAPFPYIPGYLSFREIGPLCAALALETDLPPLIFVDGNGRLHPRRAGIATTLGVVLDHPTVGIGKSLLCGRVDIDGLDAQGMREVVAGGEVIAAAIRATPTSRPIFVSPGHRIDLGDAVRFARRLFFGHRLPEPVHQADSLSKRG